MKARYITAEVEVYLDEFDTEDLIEELRDRGHDNGTSRTQDHIVYRIYEAYQLGQPLDDLLRQLFDQELGRVA